MEEEGAQNIVEAAVAERQGERIRRNTRRRCPAQVRRAVIERHHGRAAVRRADPLSNIAGRRTHIEQGKSFRRSDEGSKDPQRHAVSSEPTVDASQVAQIPFGLCGRRRFQTFGDNHEAYADQFAGITGISADTFDEAFYDEYKDVFATSDIAEFAQAAWELENNLAATYTKLFTSLEAVESQTVVASIVVINGRMATVLADLAGVSSDLDLVFDPPAEIITLPESQQS